ncbi:hypothetical protein EKG37_17875 [Robertmurraya yapensis]|uniref:Uncharacterized protein n=1 Tax=Bacillus yapensis TaxID=2492960 RepID=A0A431VZ46_9BACI|nr:hypothetical protein [Bacillus yapensis]RTR28169.1 hypothetical protein EKG37_17875 [Bacillus yapensis]TKS94413.1 hypothetical protein FAR12_17885 [Bacillus yapensis]
MNKKMLLMYLGAVFIVLFIGWFYIGQLNVSKTVQEDDTIAKQIESTETKNKKEDATNNSLQRTDSQGTLTIQVTPVPEKSSSEQLFFEVAFNTHTGDLLKYKLEQLAKISFGQNETSEGEFDWEVANEDSHHMVGNLKWNGSVLKERITLKLDNIENVPSRSFIWEKNELEQITQVDKERMDQK